MRTFYLSTLVSLFFFVAACDPLTGGSTNDTASEDGYTSNGDDGSGDGGNTYDGPHNDVVALDNFTLTGDSPDGKPVTFYVFMPADNGCAFENASATELEAAFADKNPADGPLQKFANVTTFVMSQKIFAGARSLCIYATRPNFLFVPTLTGPNAKETHTGGSTLKVEFTKYALALNAANCASADGSIKKTLTTVVKNGEVGIEGFAGIDPAIFKTYNTLSYDDDQRTLTGTVADDRTSVQYSLVIKESGMSETATLLCK